MVFNSNSYGVLGPADQSDSCSVSDLDKTLEQGIHSALDNDAK